MNTTKKVILASAVFAICLVLGCFAYFQFGLVESPKSLMVTGVRVDAGMVKITGETTSSGTAFTGYTYQLEGNDLVVQLKYALVNPLHQTGGFSIVVEEENIQRVILRGRDAGDQKVIWPET
jgi:hypothetical protein